MSRSWSCPCSRWAWSRSPIVPFSISPSARLPISPVADPRAGGSSAIFPAPPGGSRCCAVFPTGLSAWKVAVLVLFAAMEREARDFRLSLRATAIEITDPGNLITLYARHLVVGCSNEPRNMFQFTQV